MQKHDFRMTSYWNSRIAACRFHIEVRKGSKKGRHTREVENNPQGKHGTNLHRTLGAFHLKVNADSFTTQSYAALCCSSRSPANRGRKEWIIQTEWRRELSNAMRSAPSKQVQTRSPTKTQKKKSKELKWNLFWGGNFTYLVRLRRKRLVKTFTVQYKTILINRYNEMFQ